MKDILEQIRLQASLSDEESAAQEFSNIKEKFVIDRNVDYPDPEYLIRIGDVPTLPKGNLFVVSHPVSRHRQSEGLVFKLDENAIPMDATADRQLQVEIENQLPESNLREMFGDLIPEDGTPVKRKDIVEGLAKNYGFKKFKCYDMVKSAISQGWLVEIDNRLVKLRT